MKNLALLSIILFALTFAAQAQIRQGQGRTVDERTQEKAEQVERTEQERRQLEASKNGTSAEVKPAVMNVDVQMALTKLEYKNFAEAKPNVTKEITDGDNLWLYVKFNGKLDRYVYRLADENAPERYVLFVEYGPEGDTMAKSHQIIEFRKDELNLAELKMSLSPGKAGRNRSLPIFITNIALSKPGRWSNELRITNNPGFPRGFNDYLAKAAFACDFTRGFAKYPKMPRSFESMVLRDTLDETKLPIEGKFEDAALRSAISDRLAAEKIAATQVFFSGDNWLEYSSLPMTQRQYRRVTSVFQYQTGAKCLYGIAEILQTYDPSNNQYGNTTFAITKDLPTLCAVQK